MALIIEFRGKKPIVAEDVFIAPNAVIIGDVTIKRGASIWYGVVIRGDMEPILIGKNTNVQDNCTIHTDKGFPVIIGDRVSIGHNAVVHGCQIGNDCLIAIGAVILSGAMVHQYSVVAAGSVIKEGQVVNSHSLVAGAPASIKKTLAKEDVRKFQRPVGNYLKLASAHKQVLSQEPS